ncbi:hypothetical protein CHUAL_001586 [Chamberlinius hualienensis]
MEKRCMKIKVEPENENGEKVSPSVTPTTPTSSATSNLIGAAGTSDASPATTQGNFMAGHMMFSSSILDEVLNEKKMKLMQSPEVTRFLQEKLKKS